MQAVEFVTWCFHPMFGGTAISGMEVVCVVDATIVETWNSTMRTGRWG